MRDLLACSIVAIVASHASAAEPTAKASAKALEEQMQSVIEEATPSVVAIVVSHQKYPGPKPDPKAPGKLGAYSPPEPINPRFGPFLTPPTNKLDLAKPENLADNIFGTGVVIDSAKGLILTTQHVIDGATKIFVRFANGEGSYADIHASDSRSDLAVLKVINQPRTSGQVKIAAVKLVDGGNGQKPNLKRGSWIVALGHPLGAGFLDGTPTASFGIVGNIRRRTGVAPKREELQPKPLHTYGSLIQTDARITLGSSGSPIFNLDGEMVGLASSLAAITGSEASGGFAIPFDANYRRIVDVLREGGEVDYGFLGISPKSDIGGVRIMSITPGCPAADAGLRSDDLLTAIDGNSLKDSDDVLLYVGAALAGTEIRVDFNRNNRPMKATLTLAKMANPLPFTASNSGPAFQGLRVDYSSVRFIGLLNFPNAPRFAPPPGVAIKDLEIGSPADKAFKDAGDATAGWIITHVDETAVSTPAEFWKAAKEKNKIKLTLVDPADSGKIATITVQ